MISNNEVIKYINLVREKHPDLSGKQCKPLIIKEIEQCEPVSDYEMENIEEVVWERVKRLRPLKTNN